MDKQQTLEEQAERIYSAFDELGQRSTRPRRLMAERLIELARTGENFTIEDLWQDLRNLDARIGRATVFRIVEKMEDLHLVQRVEFADGSHRYSVCGGSAHHHHLTCTTCHRVVEVDLCLPEERLNQIGDQTRFEIDGHSLTIFGRCETCRNK